MAGDPGRFKRLRAKRKQTGIIHKQFRLLEKDVPEAVRLLKPLVEKAEAAYDKTNSKLADAVRGRTVAREPDDKWQPGDIKPEVKDGTDK